MNEEINNRLLDDLFEAHGMFESIIGEMKEKGINYPYDKVIMLEKCSFNISYNAISKMNNSLDQYKYIVNNNDDYFNGERKIVAKYVMVYIVSIIILKVFAKTLSVQKINEIVYGLLAIFVGSVDVFLACDAIDEYQHNTKENNILTNDLKSYKEDYKFNYEVARREISYMFSLNRNLQDEISLGKTYTKK